MSAQKDPARNDSTIIIGGESDSPLDGSGLYIVEEDSQELLPHHARKHLSNSLGDRNSENNWVQEANSVKFEGNKDGSGVSNTKNLRGSVPEPLYSIWQLLASITVPESLAVATNIQDKAMQPDFIRRVKPRVEVLEPGDIILIRTPGRIYNFFRSMSGQEYDHMGVMMTQTEFLHIGPPNIRLIPVNALLAPERNPLVLRPVGVKKEQIEALIQDLRTLIGQPYSSSRVYSFISRLALDRMASVTAPLPLPRVGDNSERFICTDAILLRLMKHSPEFARALIELQNKKIRENNRALRRSTQQIGTHQSAPVAIVESVPHFQHITEDSSEDIKFVDDVPSVGSNPHRNFEETLPSSRNNSSGGGSMDGLDFFRLHSLSISDILAMTPQGSSQAVLSSTTLTSSTLDLLSPVQSSDMKLGFVGFVPIPLPSPQDAPVDGTGEESQTRAVISLPSQRRNFRLRTMTGATTTLASSLTQVAGEAVPSLREAARTAISSGSHIMKRVLTTAMPNLSNQTINRDSTEAKEMKGKVKSAILRRSTSTISPQDKLKVSINSTGDVDSTNNSHLFSEDNSIVTDIQNALVDALSDLRGRLHVRAQAQMKLAKTRLGNAGKYILWKMWIQAKPVIRLYVITYLLAWKFPRLMFIHGKVIRMVFYIVLFGSAIRTAFETASEPFESFNFNSSQSTTSPLSQVNQISSSQLGQSLPNTSLSSVNASPSRSNLIGRTSKVVGTAASTWRNVSTSPIASMQGVFDEVTEYFLSLGGYPSASQMASGQRPKNWDKLRSSL